MYKLQTTSYKRKEEHIHPIPFLGNMGKLKCKQVNLCNHHRCAVIQLSRIPLFFVLILYWSRRRSSLSLYFQQFMLGTSFLKILPLRWVQILQHPWIITSRAIPAGSKAWMSMMSSKHEIPGFLEGKLLFQQSCAKLQSQNKCLSVSSECSLQKTQSYESKNIFFLFSRFLVFTLSCSSSQKKSLCLSLLAVFPGAFEKGVMSSSGTNYFIHLDGGIFLVLTSANPSISCCSWPLVLNHTL